MNKTCEDCIYNDVCFKEHLPTDIDPNYYDYSTRTDVDDCCDHFKDKSRYIELPCAVGDTVYCLIQGFENPLKATVNKITVQKGAVIISCSILGYFGQSYMATDFGKTVFLTKEEAEQALKGGVQE